jgi:putative ABC transport system ATP-binding protein
MDRTLFGFIWRYSKRQQIIILAMTVISFPILYMSLELPKWIVNDAISGTEFPKQFLGMTLDQVPYLVALCLVFLGLVVLNNVVKYVLNIYKGVAGERMLRRLRYMLYNSVLRFRLTRFRRVSGGEIIPMITAEVEDVGVFIGEAIATPAFQGGTLLVYIVFIFAQDPFLGAAAISLYPLQAYLIPKLQRRVQILSRQRIRNIRTISDRIAETVSAAPDIHANDTSRYHLADLSDRLFTNYRIRLAIFKRKFMIKFINNFMNQLPPFFFYSVGGYLVITGQLSFGALVAVLAAYKDLAGPWKELLDWYQNLANVSVKYEAVVENFDVDDSLSPEKFAGPDPKGPLPEPHLVLSHVTVGTGGSKQEVVDVTLDLPEGTHLAVYGSDGSGRSELLMAMAGLIEPASGKATLGGRKLEELSHASVADVVSYVGSDPYIFNDTIRGNVVYGLKRAPRGDGTDEFASLRKMEATITGNSLLDITAPWEDHERAGVDEPTKLDGRLLELFEIVGLEADLYRLGLAERLDASQTHLIEKVLKARAAVAARVAEDGKLADLVELWSSGRFVQSASIGENTLFALPTDTAIPIAETANDPVVRKALQEAGVLDDLVAMGVTVAETMIELFSGTGADASLIGDYSFLAMDEIPLFEARLRRRKTGGSLSQEDVAALVGLAFRIVPARHRIVTVDDAMGEKLVAARKTVHAALDGNGAYALFDAERFVPPLSIEENILFGKPRVDRRGASERIDGFLRDTLTELGIREPIARAGLNFPVGVAGGRLSATQRRRIGLVRALVKRPKILIFDAVADGDRSLLERLVKASEGRTVVAGTSDPQIARAMGNVAVMREGRLVATGSWDSVQQIAINGGASEMPELERKAS